MAELSKAIERVGLDMRVAALVSSHFFMMELCQGIAVMLDCRFTV